MKNVQIYGEAVAKIIGNADRLMPLGPGMPCAPVTLKAFNPLTDMGRVVDADAAKACHAGLWLYFDCLDESHEISQELHTKEGSFWHAVMHRREPDAWNSKYWWRKVGCHEVFDQLAMKPDAFVDECEKYRDSGGVEETRLVEHQLREWLLMFDWCYRKAIGLK